MNQGGGVTSAQRAHGRVTGGGGGAGKIGPPEYEPPRFAEPIVPDIPIEPPRRVERVGPWLPGYEPAPPRREKPVAALPELKIQASPRVAYMREYGAELITRTRRVATGEETSREGEFVPVRRGSRVIYMRQPG